MIVRLSKYEIKEILKKHIKTLVNQDITEKSKMKFYNSIERDSDLYYCEIEFITDEND